MVKIWYKSGGAALEFQYIPDLDWILKQKKKKKKSIHVDHGQYFYVSTLEKSNSISA